MWQALSQASPKAADAPEPRRSPPKPCRRRVAMTLLAQFMSAHAASPGRPTTAIKLANFVVFQLAWFAAVIGAARGAPLLGIASVAVANGWHLMVSERALPEACLVALAM